MSRRLDVVNARRLPPRPVKSGPWYGFARRLAHAVGPGPASPRRGPPRPRRGPVGSGGACSATGPHVPGGGRLEPVGAGGTEGDGGRRPPGGGGRARGTGRPRRGDQLSRGAGSYRAGSYRGASTSRGGRARAGPLPPRRGHTLSPRSHQGYDLGGHARAGALRLGGTSSPVEFWVPGSPRGPSLGGRPNS